MNEPVPALAVVIPAYDEEAVIGEVVADVAAVLNALPGMAPGGWRLVVVDDASTDATPRLLDELAASVPGLEVLHLAENVGHGPALRAGWDAVLDATWVAHLDGDGELPAAILAELWARRDEADLVLGVRQQRFDGTVRRSVTAVLRAVARATAGRRLDDANTPCKLVDAEALRRALAVVPEGAFAPSVLLAVAVARQGGSIIEIPVEVLPRPHRRSWLVPRRLIVGCARALAETVALTRRVRRAEPHPSHDPQR